MWLSDGRQAELECSRCVRRRDGEDLEARMLGFALEGRQSGGRSQRECMDVAQDDQ